MTQPVSNAVFTASAKATRASLYASGADASMFALLLAALGGAAGGTADGAAGGPASGGPAPTASTSQAAPTVHAAQPAAVGPVPQAGVAATAGMGSSPDHGIDAADPTVPGPIAPSNAAPGEASAGQPSLQAMAPRAGSTPTWAPVQVETPDGAGQAPTHVRPAGGPEPVARATAAALSAPAAPAPTAAPPTAGAAVAGQAAASASSAPAVASAAPTAPVPTPHAAVPVAPAAVAAQIAHAVSGLKHHEGTYRLSVHLKPEALGSVRVDVELHDGEMHLHVHAEESETRALLHDSAHSLRAELEQGGIAKATVDVALDQRPFGQPGQPGQPGHPGQLGQSPGHHPRPAESGAPADGQPTSATSTDQSAPGPVAQEGDLDLRV